MQFPAHFINIVMTCISSTKYSFLINGSLMEVFNAQRGLRQGDPMSPILFFIWMEYLSLILVYKSSLHSFGFHARCRRTKLTYLCFADDLMIFCRADLTHCRTLCFVLTLFLRSQGFFLIRRSPPFILLEFLIS